MPISGSKCEFPWRSAKVKRHIVWGCQVSQLIQSQLVKEILRICGIGKVHLTLDDMEVNELLLASRRRQVTSGEEPMVENAKPWHTATGF